MDFPKTHIKWLWENTIFLTKYGSHAYGTNISTSDTDYRGFCIPPKEYYFGRLVFDQTEFTGQTDMVVLSIKKFFSLAAQCNPSVIEILHTDRVDHVKVTELGREVLDNRDLFLSAKAKFTFSGYAIAQLKRIKNHHRWIAIEKSGETLSLEEQAKYNDWIKTRNPQRAELERKYGYDTKHGMHLVRLVRMCKEILTEGKVIVKRPDAKELIDIRNGAWPYEKLVEWAEQTDSELETLYQKTSLPHSPDYAKIDELLINVTERALEL